MLRVPISIIVLLMLLVYLILPLRLSLPILAMQSAIGSAPWPATQLMAILLILDISFLSYLLTTALSRYSIHSIPYFNLAITLGYALASLYTILIHFLLSTLPYTYCNISKHRCLLHSYYLSFFIFIYCLPYYLGMFTSGVYYTY